MTRLSNRQFPMLKEFALTDSYMPIALAQTFDQRPFRSMLIQKWIAYHPGRGFRITREGKQAWEEFRHTTIERKNHFLPLTRYFDPAAFGLHHPYRKSRMHVVPARKAGAA